MPVVLRTPRRSFSLHELPSFLTYSLTVKSKELPRPSSGPRTRSQTKPPLNPVTTHFEFLGPHGTFFAILGLPFTTLALFLLCTENGCPAPQFYNHEWAALLTTRSSEAAFWWSWEALAVVLSWFTFQLALYVLVPGPWAQGTILRSGTRLSYKINAFSCFVLTLAGLGAWVNYSNGLGPLLWLAENYLQVCTSAIAFSTTLALVLYVSSFRSTTTLLAEGGNSGYPIYDFWIGRELNPRWTSFIDLKYFCELRPGLIGWTVLNLALAAKQYQSTGTLTNSMILVVAFQAYYVIDALWNERAILTTMDITTDGFGFMLVFGDLVWVPFTYTLQGVRIIVALLDNSMGLTFGQHDI